MSVSWFADIEETRIIAIYDWVSKEYSLEEILNLIQKQPANYSYRGKPQGDRTQKWDCAKTKQLYSLKLS
jgi:hypothetical protein